MLLERGAPAHSKGSLPDPIQTVAESGDRRLLQVLLDMTIFAATPLRSFNVYIFFNVCTSNRVSSKSKILHYSCHGNTIEIL